MKNLKSVLKTIFYGAIFCASLTSCENFMNGADVRTQFEEAVAYNNAKNINVLFLPDEGTGTSIPSGKYSAKLGYFFEISFTEASGSSFDKWIAVSQTDSTPVTEGVVFEDPKSPVTRVKVSNDTTPIKIIPKCLERISIESEPTPRYASNGVYRDSTILVSFKQNLDPASFIFAETEIPQNAQKKETDGKIWAYILNDQTYFKNISITNQEGISIAEYFTQPKITGSVLTIETDKTKQIPLNANETLKTVSVTISGNIRDNVNKISMGQDLSWKYLINDSTEQKVTVNLITENGIGTIEPSGNNQYSIGQILNLSFEEDDKNQFLNWVYDNSKIYIENPNSTQTKAIILSNTSNTSTITLDTLCAVRPCVSKFEPNATENPVGKNSAITLTFNRSLPTDEEYAQTLNNILITVGGTPVNTSFLTPYVDTTDNKIVRFPANPKNILEVAEGQIKTVSVYIPADFYYPLEDGTKVTFGGNGKTYNFRIDSTTVEKAYITSTSKSNENSGELIAPTDTNGYSMEQTITISFTVNEGFHFERWFATSSYLPEGEDIADYIVFADETNPKTTITFKKPLQGIEIEAICPHLPEFNFRLTGSNGKFSPTKGTHTCTQTYNYQLSFEPDSDYEFLRWEIYDTASGDIIPNGTYIKIADMDSEDTSYEFVEKPDSSVQIAIKPVIAERPQIISYSPLYVAEGVLKDSIIQVIFDCDMDKSSLYYTSEEMEQMIENGEADSGCCEEGTVFYGYLKNNELFYKNIIIKNNETSKNYNAYFDHPRLENSRVLSIPVYRKDPDVELENIPDFRKEHLELPDYAQLLVSLDKNIYYTKDNKQISMTNSKKWIYQIEKDTDSTPPMINPTKDFFVGVSKTDEISSVNSKPSNPLTEIKCANNGLYLDFQIKDVGSGPASNFTLVLTKVYNEYYNYLSNTTELRKNCYFQKVESQVAHFDKYIDLSNYTDIADGVYSLSFEFSDKSGHSFTYPDDGTKYYFLLDKTAPDTNQVEIQTDSSVLNQLNISWQDGGFKDYKNATIEYKKADETEWTILESEYTEKTASASNLIRGTDYEFRFTFKDLIGNEKQRIISKATKPENVRNIRDVTYDFHTNTIAWDLPEHGDIDGYVIRVRDKRIGGSSTDGYWYERTYNINDKTQTQVTVDISGTYSTISNMNLMVANINGALREVYFEISTKYKSEESESTIFKTYSGFVPQIITTVNSDTQKYRMLVRFNIWLRDEDIDDFTNSIKLYAKNTQNGTYSLIGTKTNYGDYFDLNDISTTSNRYYKVTWEFTNSQGKHYVRDAVLFKWDKNQSKILAYTE